MFATSESADTEMEGGAAADVVPFGGDRPVYGGTPADAAVLEALSNLTSRGKKRLQELRRQFVIPKLANRRGCEESVVQSRQQCQYSAPLVRAVSGMPIEIPYSN